MSLTSYAVVGAAAYMGGATRMTLTTTVMVMETTGALQLIVPIMITVFVAKVQPSVDTRPLSERAKRTDLGKRGRPCLAMLPVRASVLRKKSGLGVIIHLKYF